MKTGDSQTAAQKSKPTKTARGANRKGVPATEKQKAALGSGTKKAAAERTKRAKERRELAVVEKPRWQKLEDGELSLSELTDEELIRGECANNDGTWEGRRHALSPRLVGRMKTEYKRRFSQGLEKLGPLVLEAFEDILNDDEARAQQAMVGKLVTEYTIGKVPDVVHVGQETEWDRLNQTGFVILRGRENVDAGDESGDEDEPKAIERGA